MKPTFTLDQSEKLETLFLETLPHGSGIDAKWSIAFRGPTIICENSFHNMDEYGGYCGWSDFKVTINPFEMSISLTTKNSDLREYLFDTLNHWLSTNKSAIASIMDIPIIPFEDHSTLFQSIHSWRAPLIAKYGTPDKWPAWLTAVSEKVNVLSIYIDQMTDYQGEKSK